MAESNCFLEKCRSWFGFAPVTPVSESIALLKGETMHRVLKDLNSCFNSSLEPYIWGDNLVASGFITTDEGSAQVVLVAAHAVLRQELSLENLSLIMEHSVQTEAEFRWAWPRGCWESSPGGFLELL